MSVRRLTSSPPSVWVWSTWSTSASTGSLSSNPSPAGLPTLRGEAASVRVRPQMESERVLPEHPFLVLPVNYK